MSEQIKFDGDAPAIWVLGRDARFNEFARRLEAERGTKAWPMASKWCRGDGWFFPAHYVDGQSRSTFRSTVPA